MARMYKKLAICGGEGGHEWDDDVYEGVRKVYVGQDLSRITYIKFEYVKVDGAVTTREYGKIHQQPKEFELYPNEDIKAVEGSYNVVALCATEVITSLVFKTSRGRTSPTFGPNLFGLVNGTKFVLEDSTQGKKIVGFHGRSDNALDALGVYFALDSLTTSTTSLYKLEAQGGTEGRVWDDGSYDGIKTMRIGQDNCRITYLECEYVKGDKLETRHHGMIGVAQFEIVFVPGEYIKSVEATYHKTSLLRNTVITSLKVETSAGRTSFFGYKTGKTFVLKQKDRRLVGFHGGEGDAIDALGAYFSPIPTPVPVIPATKLPAVGGNGGVAWDDGVYEGVRKIYVGQGNDGVSFVKFEYVKGTNLVSGDDHGKKTILGAEEFVIEDGEYLTVLEGYYDKIFGVEEPVIISLQFTTNKRESIQFGMDSGEKFSLGEKGHKIVGFHGQASDVLHSVGVTVVPITTTK
ncbi:hypothetical protein N665_0957s0014 [Sinapis alba]|nr:hypothetical protein N665_0957s0014 [Sinapis alba]